MQSAKAFLAKEVAALPDDMELEEALRELLLIVERKRCIEAADEPGARTYTSEEVRARLDQWLTK